jgi:hypothetical protein
MSIEIPFANVAFTLRGEAVEPVILQNGLASGVLGFLCETIVAV